MVFSNHFVVYLRTNFGKKPSADICIVAPPSLTNLLPTGLNITVRADIFLISALEIWEKGIIKSLLFVDDDHEGNVTGT